MPRTAVIVTGGPYRGKLSYKQLYDGLKSTFPEDKYDIYFTTWSNGTEWKEYWKQVNPKETCMFFREPEHKYNPFLKTQEVHDDIPKMEWNPNYQPLKWWYWGNTEVPLTDSYLYRKYFQIPNIAYAVKELPDYECYIRVRWDIVFFTKFDEYVDHVLEDPKQVYGFQDVNPGRRRVKMTGVDEPVKIPTRITEVPRFGSQEMSDNYIPDFCVIFHRDAIDADKILEVHDRQNLLPGEFGWNHILNHLSPIDTVINKFIGGVTMLKWY